MESKTQRERGLSGLPGERPGPAVALVIRAVVAALILGALYLYAVRNDGLAADMLTGMRNFLCL